MTRPNFVTPQQRDILIEHLDGLPIPLNVSDSARYSRVRGLVQLGWLEFEHCYVKRPRTSKITEKGREVLAVALGEWADAIVKAQLTNQTNAYRRSLKAG